ncbi:hypothetical protein LUZ60_003230 [Juncus effusus]|nr:hypothetical protein LUZ60_003230 [Juncus effusus]
MSSIRGMESVVASVSGYTGGDRFKLIKLIAHSGASYVGAMNRSTTHLVCWRFEGKKYEFARSIGAKIVSHRWFEDCLKEGKRIPEGPYAMQSGEEAGPILWEIPISTAGKSIEKQEQNTNRNILSDYSNFRDIKNSDTGCSNWSESLLLNEIFEWPDESNFNSFWHRSRHQTSLHDFIQKNPSKNKGKTHITNTLNSEHKSSSSKSNKAPLVDLCEENKNENENEGEETNDEVAPSQQGQVALSCVICWTEFSSTRGVLPCGHRFCYSCIQDWANRLVSIGKVSTCPLCKAAFNKITRVEEADFSDQKIYSQTVPINSRTITIGPSTSRTIPIFTSSDDLPISAFEEGVCGKCHNREPEDLLVNCEICRTKWVHSYCLDPPQFPWTCIHCRDLRMLYHRFR